ncbi:MAG: hypothetical protein AB1451_15060 [Nitrospirota bacterium]
MDSDTYIIRIYRRNKERPTSLVGVAEQVGTKEQRAFHDLDGLLAILTSSETRVHLNKEGG